MLVLRIVLVLCAGILGIAQIQNPFFHAESAEVIVDISVLEHEHPLPGLNAADFTVLDEGVQQPIAAVNEKSAPLDVLLLLDESGSMRRLGLYDWSCSTRHTVSRLAFQDPSEKLKSNLAGETKHRRVSIRGPIGCYHD